MRRWEGWKRGWQFWLLPRRSRRQYILLSLSFSCLLCIGNMLGKCWLARLQGPPKSSAGRGVERFTNVGKLPQFYWNGLKRRVSIYLLLLCVVAIVLTWRSEDNHGESVLSYLYVRSGGWKSGSYMASVLSPEPFTGPSTLGVGTEGLSTRPVLYY